MLALIQNIQEAVSPFRNCLTEKELILATNELCIAELEKESQEERLHVLLDGHNSDAVEAPLADLLRTGGSLKSFTLDEEWCHDLG